MECPRSASDLPGRRHACALFAAASHPGRIRSLVVGGGATAYPLEVGGTLKELIASRVIGNSRSQDTWGLIQGLMVTLGLAAPGDDIIAHRVESNTGDRFAEAARYVRSYPSSSRCWPGSSPRSLRRCRSSPDATTPIVPVANAEFLHTRLPNSRLDVLNTGHLAWEETPGEYGAIIAAWVTGGYLTGSTAMGRT